MHFICNNDRGLNAKQRTSNTFRIHSPVTILLWAWQAPRAVDTHYTRRNPYTKRIWHKPL